MEYQRLTRTYLEYALNFTAVEKENTQTLSAWLPEQIIDSHAHCHLLSHVGEVPEESYHHMISSFFYYSIEESKKINQLLYPQSTVRTLHFPGVFRGVRYQQANEYLLKESDPRDGVAILGSPDNVPYIVSMLEQYKPNALKMYYSYGPEKVTTIYGAFPEEVIEVAAAMEIPIILHLPRMITEMIGELVAVTKKYPKLKICVPHLGSTKFVIKELAGAYQRIAEETNIILDTSLNPSADVVRLALNYFGVDRIIYGSDQPLNLLRTKAYIHPTKGQRLITEFPYHWVDPLEHQEFKHLAVQLKHSHWSALGALKEAIEVYAMENSKEVKKIKDSIFYRTAKIFYRFSD